MDGAGVLMPKASPSLDDALSGAGALSGLPERLSQLRIGMFAERRSGMTLAVTPLNPVEGQLYP
jgi:hypothetical protein